MTIDLTGTVPQLIQACDCCRRDGEVYRLIATTDFLCERCFAMMHGAAA
ncbi:MAG: hypothetical protein JWM40_241 [Frankiales bacterium]|nr:hypothetical protein [Frankiales bacterium]